MIDGQQSGGKEIKSPVAVEEKAKPSQVRTYPNGLVIEELSMGKPDGKRASGGKKVIIFVCQLFFFVISYLLVVFPYCNKRIKLEYVSVIHLKVILYC